MPDITSSVTDDGRDDNRVVIENDGGFPANDVAIAAIFQLSQAVRELVERIKARDEQVSELTDANQMLRAAMDAMINGDDDDESETDARSN